jgi:hypothetical protein
MIVPSKVIAEAVEEDFSFFIVDSYLWLLALVLVHSYHASLFLTLSLSPAGKDDDTDSATPCPLAKVVSFSVLDGREDSAITFKFFAVCLRRLPVR